MRKFTKRSTAIVSGVTAIGAVAAGAVAYAAFSTSVEAEAGTGGAETFAATTVVAKWEGVRTTNNATVVSMKMLPGEAADVTITLTAPNGNTVQTKVKSIDAIIPLSTNTASEACLSKVKFSTYNVGERIILSSAGEVRTIVLNDAVKLDETANTSCSGMIFPVKYTVNYEATRAAVTTTASLTPVTPTTPHHPTNPS